MRRDEEQFAHYELPCLPGELLRFPNDHGGTVGIEKLGTGKAVNWNGRAGDSVKAQASTVFPPLEGPANYVFTLRKAGWLDFRFAPGED